MPRSPIDHHTFVDPAGSGLAARLRAEEQLKVNLGGRRQSWRAALDGRTVLVKMWRAGSPRQLVATSLGRTSIDREFDMLLTARRRGLPVPEPIARGARRVLGVAIGRAIVVGWLDECRDLMPQMQDAIARHDRGRLEHAITIAAGLLCRIRNAGIADSDYGVHNIVMSGGDVFWIDLEHAWPSPTEDPAGTAATTASLLASWWTTCGGDQDLLQSLFDHVVRAAPRPVSGWQPILGEIHQRVAHGVARQIRRGRVGEQPGPVTIPAC